MRKAVRFFIGAALCSLLAASWGCSGGSATSHPQKSDIPTFERSLSADRAALNPNIAIGITLEPGTLDVFGPPPAGDPSAFTGPMIGLAFAQDLLATLPPANERAFTGGATGTFVDAGVNNALSVAQQPGANVPTNGFPSPLFGAKEFTQKMLRFDTLKDAYKSQGAVKNGPFFLPVSRIRLYSDQNILTKSMLWYVE